MTKTRVTLKAFEASFRLDKDYYVNVADLNKLYKYTSFQQFYNDQKKLINRLSKQLKMSENKLIKSRNLGNSNYKTVWAHPILGLQYLIIYRTDMAMQLLASLSAYVCDAEKQTKYTKSFLEYLSIKQPSDLTDRLLTFLNSSTGLDDHVIKSSVKNIFDNYNYHDWVTLDRRVCQLGYGVVLAHYPDILYDLTEYVICYYGNPNKDNEFKSSFLLDNLILAWLSINKINLNQVKQDILSQIDINLQGINILSKCNQSDAIGNFRLKNKLDTLILMTESGIYNQTDIATELKKMRDLID